MRQLAVIAFRSLLQHRRRNGLLATAIALVTALLVLLLGLSAGMTDTMIRAATTLSTGHVNVAGFYKVTSGSAAAVLRDAQGVAAVIAREVEGIDYTIARSRGFARAISDRASLQSGVFGIDMEREEGLAKVLQPAPLRSYVEGGSDETEGGLADVSKPDTILLFAQQAERLGVRVGDTITLSAPTWRGVNNSVDLVVAFVAKDIGFMSAFNVFVPDETLHRVYQLAPEATGAIQIYLDDPARSDEVAQQLRTALSQADYRVMDPQHDPFWLKLPQVQGEDWTGQKLDVTTWKDEISFLLWTIDTFDALTVVLVIVLMVLIVIGILNTLWIAVRERTDEIGTMRAIGMSRVRVASMFFIEAGLLAVGSTLVGAGAATLVGWLVNASRIVVDNDAFQLFIMSETLVIHVDPAAALKAAATISVVTILAALAPAVRAARMSPVTAMRHG